MDKFKIFGYIRLTLMILTLIVLGTMDYYGKLTTLPDKTQMVIFVSIGVLWVSGLISNKKNNL